MSEHTTLNQNSNKNIIPSDCPICAIRPGFYLTCITVFQARCFCHHSDPPSSPHFESSRLFKSMTVVCNLILIFGICNRFSYIEGKFTPKHVLLYLEIAFNISIIISNSILLLKNNIKLLESHGLIVLIHNKFKFEVYTILSSSAAKFLHRLSLCLIISFISEEVIMFNITLLFENVNKDLLVRMFFVEVVNFLCVSLGIFSIQMFFMYHRLLDRCYYEIETFLSGLRVSEEVTQCSGGVLINRLQKLQRLYMCLRRNFKLNEELIQPYIVIILSVYVCLLLIGYGYFATTFFLGEVGMLRFDIYVLAKSLGLAIGFICICYEAQMILTLSEKLLSYLFKYPVSKLSLLESAQIEMLISSLILLKPEMKASDIFTLGTALLVSISATVVTYVLVALQFHVLLSTN